MHLALDRWWPVVGHEPVVEQKLGQHLEQYPCGRENNQSPKRRVIFFNQFRLSKESLHTLQLSYWGISSSSSLEKNCFSIVLGFFFIKDHSVQSFQNLLCNLGLLFSLSLREKPSFWFLPLGLGTNWWRTFPGSNNHITIPFPFKDLLKSLLGHVQVKWTSTTGVVVWKVTNLLPKEGICEEGNDESFLTVIFALLVFLYWNFLPQAEF